MSAARLTDQGNGHYSVSGDLDFAGVGGLLDTGSAFTTSAKRISLDLSGVERANSAGLALLLEWVDQSRRNGQELELHNLPDALIDISRMSNLLELLPIHPKS